MKNSMLLFLLLLLMLLTLFSGRRSALCAAQADKTTTEAPSSSSNLWEIARRLLTQSLVVAPSPSAAAAAAAPPHLPQPGRSRKGGHHHHHRRHRPRHQRKAAAPPRLAPNPPRLAAPAPAPAPSRRHHPHVAPSAAPFTGPARAPSPAYSSNIPLPAAPSSDCHQRCEDPFTLPPPGAPCGCVIPMEVSLQLGVPPYVFFPLVSELAQEVAAGTFLSQSQVRILGASVVENNMEKTEVNVELVPLGDAFDNTTALITAQRFWNHQVGINETLFGSYTVFYVHYQGLPPSPPSPGGNAAVPVGSRGPYVQPLSADIKKKNPKYNGGTIAVVTLSAALLAMICLIAIWFACRCRLSKPPLIVEPMLAPSSATNKKSGRGNGSVMSSSLASSTSMSFASSFAPYTGSAKTFSLSEIKRATGSFKARNIIGEGGFGRVYQGVLDDDTRVAVKLLTRDDNQGGKEFAAEVEMLSRLHHRNLVKLIGICIEEHMRCLVYELVPNGSVESHLHGIDKDTSPLDWETRLKIALGAARGLAYLHEDSNPRVIHRDFKASNILLEDDFTPKVSDFGLAKAASDEMTSHISTRVMGTFGYVAPEYAMTGHLLVKSDVYSYGVVLLELLSGRQPVDMTQPPGQENLVTWARPLLSSREGLEILVDPTLVNVPFDNLARVAAIASMCVQPEVSHRPFMGEVVQALKLVYNDSDASDGLVSGNVSVAGETRCGGHEKSDSVQTLDTDARRHTRESDSFISLDYDSGVFEGGRRQAESTQQGLFGGMQFSGSFRQAAAPSRPLFDRIRHPDNGTVSESGMLKYTSSGDSRKQAGAKNYHSDIWPL